MLKLRPLHPLLQKKAIEDLNEDPERIQKDLEAFREWIKKSTHIKSCEDDQFLVNFLRGCKYSLEKVKQKFDLYYTLRTHIPEMTRNRDPLNEKVLGAMKQGYCIPLPILESPDGPRHFLYRLGAFDPAKYSIEELIKTAQMTVDLIMYTDDNCIIAGSVAIIDFTGVQVSFFTQTTPTITKKIIMLLQDSLPIRQKGTHFINMPAIASVTFNIFLSFTNEKNKRRIRVHGKDLDALYKLVPRKILPKEYGGDAGTVQEIKTNWEKTLIENRAFFLEHENYGVDEKKRIGKTTNCESLFGLDGSFRQLTID